MSFSIALCMAVHYDSCMSTHLPFSPPFAIEGRFWITAANGAVLGRGRIALLEKIIELGSLRAAANALGMSYRYAWKQTQAMNADTNNPLISLHTGGKGGGHAELTDTGHAAIAQFHETETAFEQFLKAQTDKQA
jgi:molybdate transport system regulatory protein